MTAEEQWCYEVVERANDLSDQTLVELLVGVQTIMEQRNGRDPVDDGDPNPWRQLRRHCVAEDALHPVRLSLRWNNLPDAYGGAAIARKGSGPACIFVDPSIEYAAIEPALVHELVHFERGVQPHSVKGWERDEEERVVRAITADRLAALGHLA